MNNPCTLQVKKNKSLIPLSHPGASKAKDLFCTVYVLWGKTKFRQVVLDLLLSFF
jgi:hypothetical protein